MSKKDYDKQAPSTRATLDRDPNKDAEHFFRALPTESDWKRKLVERSISPQEMYIHQDARKWRPTHDKDGVATIVASEKRDKAVEAFMYSPPAVLSAEEKAKGMHK